MVWSGRAKPSRGFEHSLPEPIHFTGRALMVDGSGCAVAGLEADTGIGGTRADSLAT
jgi:hypothetical protein